MSVEGKDDEELSIEVFPNRPDFLTVYGVARGLRYFLEKEKALKDIVLKITMKEIITE